MTKPRLSTATTQHHSFSPSSLESWLSDNHATPWSFRHESLDVDNAPASTQYESNLELRSSEERFDSANDCEMKEEAKQGIKYCIENQISSETQIESIRATGYTLDDDNLDEVRLDWLTNSVTKVPSISSRPGPDPFEHGTVLSGFTSTVWADDMDETIREGSHGEAGVPNDLGGQPLGHLTFQTMSSPEVPPSIIEQARIIAKQRPDAKSEEEYIR